MGYEEDIPKIIDLVRRGQGTYQMRKPNTDLVEGDIISALKLGVRRFFRFNDQLAAALASYEEVLRAAARVKRAELELRDSIDDYEKASEILQEKQEIRKAEHSAKMALLRSIEATAERMSGKIDSATLRELMELARFLRG